MGKTGYAIVLGDSFNNTLGLIRSLGEAGVEVILVLVGTDRLNVSNSRYVAKTIKIETLDKAGVVLSRLADQYQYPKSLLICSNDKAAKWVDANEYWLSKLFRTPMRGKTLGDLFDKPVQCRLAEEYGITVPKSFTYHRGVVFPGGIEYPLLMKPANSNSGEKSDIHICRTREDVEKALAKASRCNDFIVQEYVEKDYEVNMIGVSTDGGVVIPGGIRKIRHYPDIYSPCSFGLFQDASTLGVNTKPIADMISATGYRGPFSVEFIRKGHRDYFMEVNFRHDGLAYAATAAGVNLLGMFVKGQPAPYEVCPTYMMDLSIDYCHVKDGHMKKGEWVKDFMRTGCQLNFNRKDPMPTVRYYLSKLVKK